MRTFLMCLVCHLMLSWRSLNLICQSLLLMILMCIRGCSYLALSSRGYVGDAMQFFVSGIQREFHMQFARAIYKVKLGVACALQERVQPCMHVPHRKIQYGGAQYLASYEFWRCTVHW